MSRYVSEGLDLSRLPKPQAVRSYDYETLLAARRVRLVAAFQDYGVAYNEADLDADPGMMLQRVDAYREFLGLAAINDAVCDVMVAWAGEGDLQNLAARSGIYQMEGESLERLRWRVLLAPEAWGVGQLPGYLLRALSAHVDVVDAGVWVDRSDTFQPVVRVAPIVAAGVWVDASDATTARKVRAPGSSDGTPSLDVLDAVRMFLNREDQKAATDVIAVQAPNLLRYQLDVVVKHRRGPDPSDLRSLSLEGLVKLADARRAPGRSIVLRAVDAAGLPAAGEDLRVLSPPADLVAMSKGDVPFCDAVTVASEVVDD